jgi:hypothetical protein
MSQPTRYRLDVQGKNYLVAMVADSQGEYVDYRNYASLQAENERLTNLLEAATIAIEANKNLVKQLKDRNERLTKTGDAMYRQAVEDAMGVWLFPAYEQWRKSKEEEA